MCHLHHNRYQVWKAPHLPFQTHYQPYPYHTPIGVDPAPKRPHESKNPDFEKVNFSNFPDQPIESSVQRETSSHPYYEIFLWLYTPVHTLSNALSMIFIRHLYRAVSGFKPTCKNTLFQNSSFWHFQKTHPTQEEFRHHKIIFVFRNYTVNNNFPDPKK